MKNVLFILCFVFFTLTSALAYDFKVLSWNVYMLPKPLQNSLQGMRSELIPEKLKATDYDLIFMQEAFMRHFRKNVAEALKGTHPYTYYLKKPRILFPFFGSGLFVVSKFPVKLVDHVYFNSCTSTDCFASKGAALIELSLPGGQKVHVVNTHLQASELAADVRLKQLGQIHDLLVRNGRSDIPRFLIGDLNIDKEAIEFKLALGLLGMNYARLTGPILTTSSRVNSCFHTGHVQKWIDHMWYDNYPGISASEMQVRVFEFSREGESCPLSDHHAIEASFHFSAQRGP